MSGLVLRSAAVARAALSEERARPKIARRGHELEFLPAAVEVLETPASPAGRTVMLLIVAFFVTATAWAWFGSIETVAVAQGRIIPGGRVKVIQPLEIGVIRAIHVEEGQHVKAGQLLIALDPTASGADRTRLQQEQMAAMTDLARLEAMLDNGPEPVSAFQPPAGADPALVAMNRALLIDRLEEQRARQAAIAQEIQQRKAELTGIMTSIETLAGIIPLLAERVDKRQILADKGYGSKLLVLQLRQELQEHQGSLALEQNRRREIEAAIAALEQRLAETVAAFRAQLQQDMSAALQRRDAAAQELLKAEKRHRQRNLTAPVAGRVQQLQVHTLGGVVNPAEPLMVIVPDDSQLEIEAMVLNKDVGFVAVGQAVEIKVESFPFTKYGLIEGEVRQISADAVQDERLGLVYPARVVLKQTQILVGERWVDLAPGMSVTAEVKTGERRTIEFFLSPFLRYQDEALRER